MKKPETFNLFFSEAESKEKSAWLSGKTVKDVALYLSTALSAPDVALKMSRWAGSQFNTLSNDVTKAMDGEFALGLRGGDQYISPLIHRLLEGHTIPEALKAAKAALPDASDAEITWQAFKALASDMSSVSGLPIATFTKEGYAEIVSKLETLGLSESYVRDFVTYTGVELLAAVVPAIGFLFLWKKKDRESFSQLIGAMGVSAIVSANPLLAIIVIIAAALEYNKRKNKSDLKKALSALSKGAILSSIVLLSSHIIAGPAWVGIVIGIILVILLRKKIEGIDYNIFITKLFSLYKDSIKKTT